jgi:hypothetical protein
MPDYSKGMIYMLEPTIHYEEGDIYYGSTTQPLHKRFYEHKHIFNYDKPGKSKKKYFKNMALKMLKLFLFKIIPVKVKKNWKRKKQNILEIINV